MSINEAGALHARARNLAAAGDDDAAQAAYLQVLALRPDDLACLIELGALAQANGHRSAARSLYARAVQLHPAAALAHVGLANILMEESDSAGAELAYRAALAAAPDCAPAHQGLARLLAASGQQAAPHWHAGFANNAVEQLRFRGTPPGIPLLLLASARGGNMHVRQWIDDRIYAVTRIYTDFCTDIAALPSPALIVNAIGDADLCADALDGAERIAATAQVGVINHPARIRATGRLDNSRRLHGIPGLATPRMLRVARARPHAAAELGFPLLLRSPGFHTGAHFLLVPGPGALEAAAAALPGDDVLAIEYLDARGKDGQARKYRVMFIDRTPYPLHLAVSHDWKVHYFSSAMAQQPALRAEEARFLSDMHGVLGPAAMAALARIAETLGLDYCGVDFALAPDGTVQLFEANATMVINPPDADAIWDYRRAPIAAALAAAAAMLHARLPAP